MSEQFKQYSCGMPQLFPSGLPAAWAQGYKSYFMLNSAEHEILDAHKYKNIKKFSIFSSSDKPRMPFFLLIKLLAFQHL